MSFSALTTKRDGEIVTPIYFANRDPARVVPTTGGELSYPPVYDHAQRKPSEKTGSVITPKQLQFTKVHLV